MMHRPISFKDLCLSFSNKSCFENFSAQVYPGSRIAIIGRNGSGKSSLLNILRDVMPSSGGKVIIPDDVTIGYIEQTINDYQDLSGGQRLNKRLTEALALAPNLLLLDEPTNHLDLSNRKILMRMLQGYQGTLIVVSHDKELLRTCTDTLWHIDNNKIHVFTGSYDDYIREIKRKRQSIEKKLSHLSREKKETHNQLMKEQKRAAKSKAKGQKSIDERKWPTIVSNAKALRAQQTSGKKKSAIDKRKQQLSSELESLRLPEIILPRFSLSSNQNASGMVLSIGMADLGYVGQNRLLKNISLSLNAKDCIAISGKNASGKSTLLKAILGKSDIIRTGSWHLPKPEDIGYLDQHYSNLNPENSVMDHLSQTRSDWRDNEIRRHLNDFLFRKNEEVNNLVSNLSGGEKTRLSLAIIAANTPRLLILDEITNNLDLETKEHVVQVLKNYPGAMIVVSHEEDFLEQIGVDHTYKIEDSTIHAN